MSFILGNDFFVIPLFGIAVFIVSYLNADRVLKFLEKRTIGQREELFRLLDKLYVDGDRKKITYTVYLMSFGLGFLLFLLLWPNVFFGLVLGIGVSILGWSLPQKYLNRVWEKRCDRIVDQMIDGMTIMTNGVRSGLAVNQCMERVVLNMTGPLPQEFNLILNQMRLGRSLNEALLEFAERIPRQDVQMFVTGVVILSETGGKLGETFATISETIRERQKIEKKIDAMTSQGRMQATLMMLMPTAILVLFAIVDPPFIKPLFSSVLGYMALLFMIGLQAMGGFIMKKIVTIKV
jgi:tight adherence protein B